MVKRVVLKIGFSADQKYLSEKISASRKIEEEKVKFSLARQPVKSMIFVSKWESNHEHRSRKIFMSEIGEFQ